MAVESFLVFIPLPSILLPIPGSIGWTRRIYPVARLVKKGRQEGRNGEPETKERKFEDVVKAAEQAAVLVSKTGRQERERVDRIICWQNDVPKFQAELFCHQ